MARGGREGFPKSARLRKRPEFLQISRTGRKVHSPNFIVIRRTAQGEESRLGVTVSAKVGNAVARNRIKRLVREIFRLRRYEWPAVADIVVIAKKGAGELSSKDIREEIETNLGAAKDRRNRA